MTILPIPETFKIYMLIRQTGMHFSNAGDYTSLSYGHGFYITRNEAEVARTAEILKLPQGSGDLLHVFELDIPNPAFKK